MANMQKLGIAPRSQRETRMRKSGVALGLLHVARPQFALLGRGVQEGARLLAEGLLHVVVIVMITVSSPDLYFAHDSGTNQVLDAERSDSCCCTSSEIEEC